MPFTSQDQLINAISSGNTDGIVFQKTMVAAGTAGAWYDLNTSAGTVPAATFGGAEATFVATDNTWTEGAIPIGDQTAPITKHLLNCGASIVAAAGAPWFVQLVDMVGYAKLTTTNVSTTGVKTITMTPIGSTAANVDRYPNGAGLRVYVSAIATMGANAPTLQVTYTNSTGGTGRVTTAGTVSTATAPNGTILNTGNAANKYGPFLPLQGNDSGISDIESLTWGGTAHASGSVAICLVKPLGQPIPVPASGIYNIMDYLNTIPSLPRLRNGANIRAILFNTAATTSGATVYLNFDYAFA
jgi:hypothetical protein